MPQPQEFTWHDGRDLCLEGRGWTDVGAPFRRLPGRAREKVHPEVWQRACSPAGLSVRLRTDAKEIRLRWRLGAEPPQPATIRTAGLDGYGKADDGRWLWIGCAQPGQGCEHAASLNSAPLDGRAREYRIYLPLGCELAELEVGLPRGALAEAVVPDDRPPIVLYGTSIAQGAGVSRPGLCWPSVLSRRLDWPLVNLGFSSFGKMDAPVAELMAEIDAALFVIDCLPNTEAGAVRERLPGLVGILRRSRPRTPILLVGDRLFGDGAFIPARREMQAARSQAQRDVLAELRAENVPALHLLDEQNFFGDDCEGSTDTVHPNDVGAMRMAEAALPAVRRILAEAREGPAA